MATAITVMSSSANISPRTPRAAKLRVKTSPVSPSQELADVLASIKLNDEEESVDQEHNAGALSDVLQDVSDKLDRIKEQFFTIQERRHAGVFALSERDNNDQLASTPSGDLKAEVDKSVALDVAMAQLNALLEAASEGMKAAEASFKALDSNSTDGFSPRKRTGSVASLSSLDSFDDAFLKIGDRSENPDTMKRRYETLSAQWTSVQREASQVEEELSGDKYLIVFNSIAEQMEGMMDSLDKSLSSCHDFIFTYHRDRAESNLTASSPLGRSTTHWNSRKDLMEEFKSVKRSFEVKRSTYGPACEQMFVSLEKGVRQRSTQNGTILRKLSELKARWKTLREKVSKMDKDLKRIHQELSYDESTGSPTSTTKRSPGENLLTPSRAGKPRPKSQLRYRSDNDAHSPTAMNRSTSSNDVFADGPSQALSPTKINVHVSPQPTESALLRSPPVKPPKSLNRRSFMLEKPGTKSANPQSHGRSYSTASHVSPIPPVPSLRGSIYAKPNTFSRFVPTTSNQSARGGSEPPEDRRAVPNDLSADMSMECMRDVGDVSFNSTGSVLRRRPSSAAGHYNRPPSAAGSYYRPPSASGHRNESEGASRIPRLSIGPARSTNGDASSAGDRPESAMSMNSTTPYGKSPGMRLSSAVRGQHPPSSFGMNQDRGNRRSMQTPEPTIAARAHRMNLFAPKAGSTLATPSNGKRSSRPPPAKFNASVFGASASTSSSSGVNGATQRGIPASPSSSSVISAASPSAYRATHSTKPLNVVSKRSSMSSWGDFGGRATPLSAAALAKVPHGGPDLSEHTQGNISVSSTGTYRVQREHPSGRSYTPSALSGRATPTFSEGGQSSVWGGHSARRYAAVYTYRPNKNDAIDVEVANVVNSLGMAIERIDPPLPRGVKDLTPSSTKTVKYEVGGKTIACKLLQLHKPSSVHSNDEKTNKVLTRVGGGWIDLRQYLLSRLGTA